MGTLNYMAPEQGLKGACDARSDIYSLGIVFYEMLTRSIPFDADTPLAILMKHLNDPLPLPRQVDPSIPESFERVVLKALAKQPQDRYQDAQEMAQALQDAAKEAGIGIPAQVLPLALAGEGALSESVAIFSGTARDEILDAEFADGETDTALEDRLALERAVSGSNDPFTAIQVKSTSEKTQSTPERTQGTPERTQGASTEALAEALSTPVRIRSDRGAPERTRGAPGSIASAQLIAAEAFSGFFDRLVEQKIFQVRLSVGVAVPIGIGLALGGNLAAVWLAGWTNNWAIFQVGWPIEFFLAGLALSFIMYGTAAIWLLLPAWILIGNGLVFAYCSLTDNWQHWIFLWPMEPFVIGSAIWTTIWLAKRRDLARRISRPLGFGLAAGCVLWSLIVAIGAMAVGVFR
jgi:hypothetical protein